METMSVTALLEADVASCKPAGSRSAEISVFGADSHPLDALYLRTVSDLIKLKSEGASIGEIQGSRSWIQLRSLKESHPERYDDPAGILFSSWPHA